MNDDYTKREFIAKWKLETDRERVGGGREIKTINEWQELPN